MNYLVLGGILAAVTPYALSLQCHQCQTLEYKTCRDPYDTDNLADCEDNQYCVKYKTIVKLRDSGYIDGWERHSQVVTRSCEAKAGRLPGCTAWQNNGGITIKCWCNTDGCNSGLTLHQNTNIFLLTCLMTVLMVTLQRLH